MQYNVDSIGPHTMSEWEEDCQRCPSNLQMLRDLVKRRWHHPMSLTFITVLLTMCCAASIAYARRARLRMQWRRLPALPPEMMPIPMEQSAVQLDEHIFAICIHFLRQRGTTSQLASYLAVDQQKLETSLMQYALLRVLSWTPTAILPG